MDNNNKRRLEDDEGENGVEEQPTPTETNSNEVDASSNNNNALVVKKQKTEGEIVAVPSDERSKQLATIQRTSNLQAPIMLLTGHKAEVYSCRFSPSGAHLASSSFDKSIYLWNVYGECENYLMLRGHTNAVLEVQWTLDENHLLSASADKSVAVWDANTGARVKKCSGHSSFVNSVCPSRKSPHVFVSGSDDNKVKIWDIRVKAAAFSLDNRYPVTAVSFAGDDTQVISAGIDNDIKIWDVRKNDVVIKLDGHLDTVTGIRLSPDGSYLLSHSMDNTVRVWDVRPYCPIPRCLKIFQGATHNFERTLLRCAWSSDGQKIAAGSADRFVYVWDSTSRKILYKLPGHRGAVNDVDFHPKEPILASASADSTIYLGEIKD